MYPMSSGGHVTALTKKAIANVHKKTIKDCLKNNYTGIICHNVHTYCTHGCICVQHERERYTN